MCESLDRQMAQAPYLSPLGEFIVWFQCGFLFQVMAGIIPLRDACIVFAVCFLWSMISGGDGFQLLDDIGQGRKSLFHRLWGAHIDAS
jgi:hypothetical protein